MFCVVRATRISSVVARAMLPPVSRGACTLASRRPAAWFTKSSEWFRADNSTAVLGISEFAQSRIGKIGFCDLPAEGTRLDAGDSICTLESPKGVGKVFAPVDCEVLAVNEKLEEIPGLVNSNATGNGWLVKLRPDAMFEFENWLNSVRILNTTCAKSSPLLPKACTAADRGFSAVGFTKTHEWVRFDLSISVLGISEFAQSQVGEVLYCDLPAKGDRIEAGEAICTLEGAKAVRKVYAPVDCEVLDVNANIEKTPELVNNSPMGDGWLLKFRPAAFVEGLMEEDAYTKHVGKVSKTIKTQIRA